MRLLVHDFAGHAFPAHLARALARRGIEVDHASCAGVTTGQGDLVRRSDDPDSLRFTTVSGEPFERYSPIRRLRSEHRYGRLLARHAARTRPDVVLSGNTPLVSQAWLWRSAGGIGARRVFWVQDFLGRGTRAVLADRSPLLGHTAGAAFERLETALLRASDAAVLIAEDFRSELDRRSIAVPATVIENWAPLSEIAPVSKDNPWSRAHGLADRPVAVYSGTLGLKHDPDHLVATARALRGTGRALLVVTEGRGRDHLEAVRRREGLTELVLMDFVAYADLSAVLGTADVALVLLEADAGTFSVPSKLLAYLAAGRPVVAAVPAENLSARTIERAGAGITTPPGDHEGFAAAVVDMLADAEMRSDMGARGRRHAELAFDVERIADAFLAVLEPDGGADPVRAR